jgi:hypothetical protein
VLESLVVTLEIYRRAFARGAVLAVKNWPVLGSVFAYLGILRGGAYLAGYLGIAGGFVLSFVSAACVGSFLYLVEAIVRTNRVNWEDFRRSFGIYLWDVVGVSFALWLFWQVVTPLLHQMPQGPVIVLCINLLILVLFNAIPELIYLGHHTLLQLLSRSYEFVASNWIEWFPPNLLLLVGLAGIWMFPAPGLAQRIIQTAAAALFLYFAMVVRGLLFIELDGSTRRSRIFRHKIGR